MSKYVHKQGEIAHCPHCRGVILRDLKLNSSHDGTSFTIRCPHCSLTIHVVIDDGIIIIKEEN